MTLLTAGGTVVSWESTPVDTKSMQKSNFHSLLQARPLESFLYTVVHFVHAMMAHLIM